MKLFSFSRKSKDFASQAILKPVATNWAQMVGLDFDDYKAGFASIRAIADIFDDVVPYATLNGYRIDDPNPLRLLSSPNEDMSFYDFADYLISSILSQAHTLVLVNWKTNGQGQELPHISANIDGYSFLPPASRMIDGNGQVRYQFTKANGEMIAVGRDTVMEFYYSQDTDQWGRGVSPIQAVKKWATIADYIADYQAGYFQNGAKPDGMFIITANNKEQFDSAKEQMERVHRRGARGHGNYQYAFRPTDEQGNPLKTTSVEWVSFGAANKDLALSDLLTNSQKRIDSAYGVPAIARGDDATATFSNAQVANANLGKKVDTLLKRVWFRFYHELQRICEDELNWSIAFDYEVPALADAEKAKADTDNVRADAILKLVNAGATCEAAAKALGLSDEWAQLGLVKTEPIEPVAVEQHPVVVEHSHEPVIENRRYAGDKLTPRQKIVNAVIAENRRIIRSIRESQNAYEVPDEVVEEFAQKLHDILNPINVEAFTVGVRTIAKEFGLNQPEDVRSLLDDEGWVARIKRVARDHDRSIAEQVQAVIYQATAEEWTAKELSEKLQDFVSEKKADVLARNEVVNAQRYGRLNSAQALAHANGLKAYQVWHVNPGCCPLCAALDGREIEVGDPFFAEGQTFDVDGKTYSFNFGDVVTCDAHVNCRCYPTWRFE